MFTWDWYVHVAYRCTALLQSLLPRGLVARTYSLRSPMFHRQQSLNLKSKSCCPQGPVSVMLTYWMCPARVHNKLLAMMEITRSPFSEDLPCDSSRLFVNGRRKRGASCRSVNGGQSAGARFSKMSRACY